MYQWIPELGREETKEERWARIKEDIRTYQKAHAAGDAALARETAGRVWEEHERYVKLVVKKWLKGKGIWFRRQEIAADGFQTCQVEFMRALIRFNPDFPNPFICYLHRFLVNGLRRTSKVQVRQNHHDALRSDLDENTPLEEVAVARATDPFETLCAEAAARDVDLVPTQWRTILKRYYGLGCPPENDGEIARKMGVTRALIGDKRRKGLAFLRNRYERTT